MATGAQARTVVIAAGGTGGHLFPAQALAEELTRRGARIVLITDERGRTYTDAFPDAEIWMVRAATVAGRGLFGKIRALAAVGIGIVQAWWVLGKLKPAAVIGFGGYPSLPAVAGATLRRLPTCIHEQNAVLGRVNRAMAPYVDLIACGFEGLRAVKAKDRKRVVVTGNPVRDTITARRLDHYTAPDGNGPLNLLVFGGSQGASIFSRVVPEALQSLDDSLRRRIRLTQQCRPEDLERVREIYADARIDADLAPFFSDMAERLSKAHLVVSRAGASTVSELAVIGRPAILVPYAAAMDDHQTHNAAVIEDSGGAWRIAEKDFTVERFAQHLDERLRAPAKLVVAAESVRTAGMPRATQALADLVDGLATRGHAYAREQVAGQTARTGA